MDFIITVALLIFGVFEFITNLFFFIFRRYNLASIQNFELPKHASKPVIMSKVKRMIVLGLIIALLTILAFTQDNYLFTKIALVVWSVFTVIDLIEYKKIVNLLYTFAIITITIIYLF